MSFSQSPTAQLPSLPMAMSNRYSSPLRNLSSLPTSLDSSTPKLPTIPLPSDMTPREINERLSSSVTQSVPTVSLLNAPATVEAVKTAESSALHENKIFRERKAILENSLNIILDEAVTDNEIGRLFKQGFKLYVLASIVERTSIGSTVTTANLTLNRDNMSSLLSQWTDKFSKTRR